VTRQRHHGSTTGESENEQSAVMKVFIIHLYWHGTSQSRSSYEA
jgi:hypothetical protein